MGELDNSFAELEQLFKRRLAIGGELEESLETSRLALGRNDAEAIARGAAHQAELCRQWSKLEEQLRTEATARRKQARARLAAGSAEGTRAAELEAEWTALAARIRYLARVHWSLVRHMQRSLAVWSRVVESCAPTYGPPSRLESRRTYDGRS